jgi:hypothetical protein
MIGTTRTTRRLATGLALAASAAALAAPSGLAGGKHDYGPPDPWELPYLTTSSGFVTDTTDTARVARLAGGMRDGTAAASMERHFRHEDTLPGSKGATSYGLRSGFVTDTLDSARVARLQPVATAVSGGFDWGSFGIGIGAGIGGLLALGALAARSGRLRRPVSA